MKRITIICTSAICTFLVWGFASAHIYEGVWFDDGPDVEEGFAFGAGMKAYVYRDSLMHTMRTQHNLLRDMNDGKIEMDKELFINASKAFSALITMIPHAFGPKVVIPGTRVKPGIWEHWDMFVDLAEHYKQQVEEVTRVASREGVMAAKPFVDAIDCGYCHRPFRIQDHEMDMSYDSFVISGNADSGENLYKSMGCIGCHGAGRNRMQRMERFPLLAGRDENYLVTQLKAFRGGQRPGLIMPAIARSLTDGQISSLAAYLSAQE
jgi:cytochrome c553